MKKIKSLIIGYGSIGKRHAQIQNELNIQVSLVTKQSVSEFDTYQSISEAFNHFTPDFVLISNETSKHLETLTQLNDLNYQGKIICEKPIHANSFSEDKIKNIKDRLLIAYNLRFHPLIINLKEHIKNENVISFNCYVGQYLPDWRPGTDYTQSYSAKKSLGGGVLRDLSHEIDYCLYLFGAPKSYKVYKTKCSNLEIDTDDFALINWQLKSGALGVINLNYLDKKANRFAIVNTNLNTYKLDFVAGRLWKNNSEFEIVSERNTTYTNMYHSFINEDYANFCSPSEALLTLKIIESAEINF